MIDAYQSLFPLFPMEKYITDAIHNSLRSVTGPLTRPQQKTIEEIVRGLFTKGEPILTHLAQNPDVSSGKQAEKYSYHLGNVDLTESVEALALRKVVSTVRKNTIIAYDITDLAKDYAETMEQISPVWDGSRGLVSPGFLLHGIGVNGTLLTLRLHDGNAQTEPQVRFTLVEKVSSALGKKGIWVFDRGNDSREFFRDLRRSLKVRFIARVKDNRTVVLVKTGECLSIDQVPEGRHAVRLLGERPGSIDPEIWTLVVHRHRGTKEPIRLLTNLAWEECSDRQIVTMYLKRWGIENTFRSAKVCFGLESVRVQSALKLRNLIALIQLVVVLSAHLFRMIQKSTYTLVVGLLHAYTFFLNKRSLTLNHDSFVRFLRQSLPPLIRREKTVPDQLRLFSPPTLLKLA